MIIRPFPTHGHVPETADLHLVAIGLTKAHKLTHQPQTATVIESGVDANRLTATVYTVDVWLLNAGRNIRRRFRENG